MSSVVMASEAQASEQSFSWDAPAECADPRPVMATVAELTGEDPPVFPPDRQIRARVERRGSGWQLSLTLFDGTRERSRQIVAPSCSELTRAAGVSIALALEPGAEVIAPTPELQDPGDERHADAGPGLDASAPVPASIAGTAAASAPAELGWRLEAAALLDAVALGAPAPGLGVSLGARRGAITALVYGAWLPPRREGVDARGSVEFSLLAGGARACHEFARGLLAADACAGVEVGRFAASGQRLENSASYADWWLAPSLGLALGSASVGPWYVRAGVDALVPVLREAYRVNDGALVHRPPSFGFRGGIALGCVIGGA